MLNTLRAVALIFLAAVNGLLIFQITQRDATIRETRNQLAMSQAAVNVLLSDAQKSNSLLTQAAEHSAADNKALKLADEHLKKLNDALGATSLKVEMRGINEFGAGVRCGIEGLLDLVMIKGHKNGDAILKPEDLMSAELVNAVNQHRAAEFPDLPQHPFKKIEW